MALLLSAPQCFFLGMVAFGLLGFIQGWRRAIILMAFTLAGILFLAFNGGQALANLVFERFPVIWREVFSSSPGGQVATPSAPTANQVFLTTLITFLAIVGIGFLVGQRAFDARTSAGTPFGRIIGIIPGLVTGYFFITYLANLFNSSVVEVGVSTPGQNILTQNVPILFLIGVVVLIVGLITTRVRRSGSKK